MSERKEELLHDIEQLESEARQVSEDAEDAYDHADNASYQADQLSRKLKAIKKSVETLDDREVPDDVIGLLQDVKSAMSCVADEIQARKGEEISPTVIEFTETLENSEERIEDWLEENYYE